MERGSSKESRAMRNGLMWVVCLPPKFEVMYGPGLLSRAMSGSVVLMQCGGLFVSMANVTTEGSENTQILCHQL